MLQFLRSALPWVLAGTLFAGGWNLGASHERANYQEVIHAQYITKQKATEDTQREVSRVSKEYQDEIASLEGSTDRVINDLRDHNKRMYVRIKALTGTTESGGRCELDGRAELHEATAKGLIRVTQSADAHVRALQSVIKELQHEQQ